MTSLDPSWLLALPLLFVMGWLSARLDLRQQRAAQWASRDRLPDVITALVMKDQSTASQALLEAIRETPDDLRLQQSLGILLRDRGEPDRAIEVRLSLLARPGLPEYFRQAALLELARDYLAAGIFDRAEQSLALLEGTPLQTEALWLRLHLMQRQRLWDEAYATAQQLVDRTASPQLLRTERFHFLMEAGRIEEAAALIPDHSRLNQSATDAAASMDPAASMGLFVCTQCGFQARRHGWQCAGCGHWDTLAALS